MEGGAGYTVSGRALDEGPVKGVFTSKDGSVAAVGMRDRIPPAADESAC